MERRSAPRAWPVLVAVVLLCAVYTYWHLRRGLLPHDDGALAQSAERVLRGELPHRDFDDVYTGGLAWLNAWGFRAFGTTMWSMRLVLLAAFVAWIPAVFYIATRFVSRFPAGAVTLLAAAWTVPNYTAPMPSWYNLFLATGGVAMLLRHLEQPRARWLVAAGVMGGLSILIKVVGLYYVAGVLLYLVFQAHAVSRANARGVAPASAPGYAAVVTGTLCVFVAGLLLLVRHELEGPEVVQFVVPGALIAAFLAWNEWTHPAGESSARFQALARLLVPFLIGIALPTAIFLVPYVRSGSVPALLNGVFILPTKRFGSAVRHVAPLDTILGLLPFAGLILVNRRWPKMLPTPVLCVLGVVLALVVAISGLNSHVYRIAWNVLFNLIPALTMAALAILASERAGSILAPRRRSQLVLLVAVTALCSLIQFPFAAPIYLCYVLPLAFLTGVALYTHRRPRLDPLGLLLVGFFLVFAVMRVNTSTLQGMGWWYAAYQPTRPLELERAGLDVFEYQRMEYTEIVRLLRKHARGGYTWASPDVPEIYFLSGLRNPTRSLFDFFDDTTGRSARITQAIETHGVTAVVLNRNPAFSSRITNQTFDDIAQRFPAWEDVGHFQVRWRP